VVSGKLCVVKDEFQFLRGERLLLRALEPGDVDTLLAWENDMRVWSVSNTLTPFSRFQIEEYVLQAQHDIFTTRQLRLMIDRIEPGREAPSIGTVDLFDFDPLHRRAGTGILIRESFRASGYASEAMKLLIKYAFGTLRLHQLYCNILPGNKPSLKLFEKLGFVRCGVKKDWIHEGRAWQEEWMFQLIHQDGQG
jgi:diamine N-acetyltransferase